MCNSSVCLNTTSASDPSCSGNTCPIVLLLVVDNEEQFVSKTGKCRLHITCKISTIGSCSKSLFNHHLWCYIPIFFKSGQIKFWIADNYTGDSNSSPAQYTTQETTQKSITSLVSKYVNETSRITQTTTTRIELESTPVVGNTTLIQEFPKNETLTQRYCVYGKLLSY